MSCGKVCYESLEAARSFAQRRAYAAGDKRQRVYHCSACSGWHCTTDRDDSSRSRRRRRMSVVR